MENLIDSPLPENRTEKNEPEFIIYFLIIALSTCILVLDKGYFLLTGTYYELPSYFITAEDYILKIGKVSMFVALFRYARRFHIDTPIAISLFIITVLMLINTIASPVIPDTFTEITATHMMIIGQAIIHFSLYIFMAIRIRKIQHAPLFKTYFRYFIIVTLCSALLGGIFSAVLTHVLNSSVETVIVSQFVISRLPDIVVLFFLYKVVRGTKT